MLSLLDRCILEFDHGLRTLFAPPPNSPTTPGDGEPEPELTPRQKSESAALMRINHCGEICAQALYRGQAWFSRNPNIQAVLKQSEQEEVAHLAWCLRRIHELGEHTSITTPFWYSTSFTLGMCVSLLGDHWNLGFLAETEQQVSQHLNRHLSRLPANDTKSRAILVQMREDEQKHATTALHQGGVALPYPFPGMMKLASRAMTTITYWV